MSEDLEQPLRDISTYRSLDGVKPTVTHKDVRAAFKRIDVDDDGIIATEDISAVFEFLGFPVGNEILEAAEQHYEPTITYEDFLQKMSPILFAGSEQDETLQLTTLHHSISDDTMEEDGHPDDPSLKGINSIINMILEQSQSALQHGVNSPTIPTKYSDLGDLDALIGDAQIDETEESIHDVLSRRDTTLDLLQKKHEEETRKLLQEKNILVATLAKLDQHVGLKGSGTTVEETVKSVVQAFQDKDVEIQRQKEMINELVKRLRERGQLEPSDSDSKSQQDQQTMNLLEGLRYKLSYEYILKELDKESKPSHSLIETKGREVAKGQPKRLFGDEDDDSNGDLPLTPELRRAVLKLAVQYEHELKQTIESAKQDAQKRKSLADDNSWLWMQISQLKKQLEDAFDIVGEAKGKIGAKPDNDNCVIS